MKALDVVRSLAGSTAEQRLERRAQRLPSDELVMWAGSTCGAVQRAFEDWQTKGLSDGLQEARVGTASLLVVLEELERRRVLGRL